MITRYLLPRICLVGSLTLGLAACGELPEGEGEDIELSQLQGLDVPADYAGGREVRNKGTLTVGRTKTAIMTGRDYYHGFVLTASRGQTIGLRGFGVAAGMMFVALYGPQKADGSWGTQLAKRWYYRDYKIPVLEHVTTNAGKYLAVVAMPQRAGDASYALTACDGECTANVCLEWVNGAFEAYAALNVQNRTEANFIEGGFRAELAQSLVIRTGSCGSQSRACTRERKPVCASVAGTRVAPQTMQNLCLAKGLLYDAIGDKFGPKVLTATAGACQ